MGFMPYFIRKWNRKRHWNAFGETNRRVRELEVTLNGIDERFWPHDHAHIAADLDRLRARSAALREKLTQEV